MKIFDFLKIMTRIIVVTTNGFALNHDKSLQNYFFYVKSQVKNDFLKDVESTVVCGYLHCSAYGSFPVLPQVFSINVTCA